MTQFELFRIEQIQDIHQATLRVLQETGIVLTHPAARQLLASAGCTLAGERVHLPAELVETCIARCPRQVTLHGRAGSKTLGDGSLNFHNLGGARDIYDERLGAARYATLQDLHDATRLLDALPNCTTIVPFFTPQDVPGPLMSLSMYRHTLPFTTKPVQGPGVQTACEVRYAARLVEVLGNPENWLSLSVSPISPLTFPDGGVQAMMEIARLGIPFGPLPCPTGGTTAPMSISGALTQQNAEILASIVLAQLVRPELPVIYCGRLAMMEPRTGGSVWGGVEMGLASAGTVQIAHYYEVPVNVYGFSTNSHAIDVQNGYERALNMLLPALAGADELSGIGEYEAGVISSFAQMVLDNEFAGSIRRVRQGISTEPDALAVDLIASVMAAGRNFAAERHTVRYLRGGEVFITRLAERGGREAWEQDGRRGMLERAQYEAERILREHQVLPLEVHQERELDAIMAAAAVELTSQ